MSNKRNDVIQIRLSPNEKQQWAAAARREGRPLSAWIREIMTVLAATDTPEIPRKAARRPKATETESPSDVKSVFSRLGTL